MRSRVRALCHFGERRARGRQLVPFLLATGILSLGGVARANVTIAVAPAVHRVASDGVTSYACSNRLDVPGCVAEGTQAVGKRDCDDDTAIAITLSVNGLPDPSGTLQVWAGTTDCTQPGATNDTSTGTCWPVVATPAPAALTFLDVRVADIVASIGAVAPPQTYASTPAATACSNTAANALSTVGVYFLWVPNGSSTPSASATYPVKVKLGPPGACTNVTTTASSATSLDMTWSAPSDPALAGYEVFAAPCASTIDPSQPSLQLVGATATLATVSSLAPQTSYETAVAAVDDFGNVGPLSPSATCTTTSEELVKGCSCTTTGAPTGDGALALFALGAVGALRKRRR